MTTKQSRTYGTLALALGSLPVLALTVPVLSVFFLALLTLLIPLMIMLSPVVLVGFLVFMLGSTRDKGIPAVAVADARAANLRAPILNV